MADRHDPRYVSTSDPTVRYRAVVRGEIDLGGWSGDEASLADFRDAVRDEFRTGTGETLADEEIAVESVRC